MSEAYPTPSWDSVLASTHGMSVLVEGASADGTPGGDTIIDFQFADEREVQGGDVSAWSAAFGDAVTLGVFALDQEVRRIATRAKIPANKIWALRVGYSMLLPAGLIFRVTYHSVGTEAPQITANLMTWVSGNGA